jgi:hypothetical protein
MREDLQLAAFAVANGFALQTDRMSNRGDRLAPCHFDTRGIPHDGLQFTLGRWHVWQTARGYRVSALDGDRFPKPSPHEFHAKLFAALAVAIANHETERAATSGAGSNEKGI